MNDILLILHFVGLALGFAGGIATGITMRFVAEANSEGAMALKRLPPVFARVSGAGLVLLWVSGLILIWSRYGGPGNLPGLFWLKIVFVLILTALVGIQHATYAQIRRTGNAALGQKLKVIGPASGLSALVALCIAVFVFH